MLRSLHSTKRFQVILRWGTDIWLLILLRNTGQLHIIDLKDPRKEKTLQHCWHIELNTVKNGLSLVGIKAPQEGCIGISRVTITELLISSLGLLSGPFSHFINELSLGCLQGSPAHSWFIMCNVVNSRGRWEEAGGLYWEALTHPYTTINTTISIVIST